LLVPCQSLRNTGIRSLNLFNLDYGIVQVPYPAEYALPKDPNPCTRLANTFVSFTALRSTPRLFHGTTLVSLILALDGSKGQPIRTRQEGYLRRQGRE
jgi:hypothetical protein